MARTVTDTLRQIGSGNAPEMRADRAEDPHIGFGEVL
jgi:hypothetical protein